MRIYQQPLDEHTLWNHLQNREFELAIEVVDWYYSRTNPDGFDDPNGITKAEHLEPSHKVPIDLTREYQIKKSKMSYGTPLIAMLLFALFFAFLSLKTNSWYPMLIPSPLGPFALIALLIMVFDRKPMITINSKQLVFRKSTKESIKWNNILQIYFYYRSPFPRAGPFSDSTFIEIYKKNAVKPESYNIKDLELKPTDIVFLVNEYKKKYEN